METIKCLLFTKYYYTMWPTNNSSYLISFTLLTPFSSTSFNMTAFFTKIADRAPELIPLRVTTPFLQEMLSIGISTETTLRMASLMRLRNKTSLVKEF